MEINNREIASLFWLVAVILGILIFSSSRGELLDAFKAALKASTDQKILIIYAAFLAYVGIIVSLCYVVGFWNSAYAKDTILWAFGAFVLLFKLNENGTFREKMRSIAFRCLSMTFIVEYIANLASYNLIAELIITPIMSIVVCCSVLAEYNDKHEIIRKPLKTIISLYGLFVLSYTIYKFASDDSIKLAVELKKFSIPLVLTFLYVPFPYLFFLFCKYEKIETIIMIRTKDKEITRKIMRRFFRRFRFNLFALEEWQREGHLIRLRTLADADEALKVPVKNQ